jgi:hypothetical protein
MCATILERTPRLLALLLVVALVVATVSTAGAAGPAQQSGARPLAVSVPPEPTAVVLGAASLIRVRVLNPGDAPVIVTVTGGAVQLGDDGTAAVVAQADPSWQDLVDFPLTPLIVPAHGFVDAPLTVHVPAHLSPDLYFVGFLVTPEATGVGNLHIINQVGSFVTLDVPGPRDRELSAALDGSRFVLGWQSQNSARVGNVGHAAVRYWAENDTTSFPGGGTPAQQRMDKSLVPVGNERSLIVVGKPAWPIGLVTMKVHIFYPGATEDATQEIVLTKRVLVVTPFAVAALAALVVAVAFWLFRRLRRRHRQLSGVTRGLPIATTGVAPGIWPVSPPGHGQ